MEQTAQNNNINLHLNSKGKYHWSIQTEYSPKQDAKQIIYWLKLLDEELRKTFPNNSTVVISGRSGFVEVDPFKEEDND